MTVARQRSSSQTNVFVSKDQFQRDRAALVRLCAGISGCRDAADDLAQEALIEAWRNAHKLRDPNARQAWLHGIARNVCRRWLRAQGLEQERWPRNRVDWDVLSATVAEHAEAPELVERSELSTLLQSGLDQLPPRTRQILRERYLGDRSNTAIAASLDMSESAVGVALHRGKRQLRQALASGSEAGLTDWGIRPAALDPWQRTRIWCAGCGQRQLIGRFDRDTGYVAFRCPDCHRDGTQTASHRSVDLFRGISGYKPALNRLMSWWHDAWVRGYTDGRTACHLCGSWAEYRVGMPADRPLSDKLGAHFACPSCGPILDMTIGGLTKLTPPGRRFWRAHTRIRTLPEQAMERDGTAISLVRLESIEGSASLDVMYVRDTCALFEARASALE